jgi:hypothetical protein
MAMALAWALAALLLFIDARHSGDYLDAVGRLGLRGDAQAPTPLKQAFPAVAIDAMTWVRHALFLAEGGGPRLRYTRIDNAPEGREVHWNSGWAWTLVAAGRIYQRVAGGELAPAVEKATIWLNPFAYLLAIIALSAWTARQAGTLAGVFLAAAMALHERIAEGFLPGYVDHHGLLAVCVLGIVLGAAWMGRRGAVFSAACGALGLWVSAASVVPAIALAGLAGLVLAMDRGMRAAGGGLLDAAAWRTWGRVGAAASFAFYLAEYFPQHLGWHLEANHPLYSLAWLGGAEFVARTLEGRRAPRDFAWPLLAVLAPPAAALVGGARVLAFADPFLAGVHRSIGEFRPLWSTLRMSEPGLVFRFAVLDVLPLAAGLATIWRRGRATPPAVVFATIVAMGLEMMAWWQTRWHMNASAAQVPLALLLVLHWTGRKAAVVRWVWAAAVVAALYVPGAFEGHAQMARLAAGGKASPVDARVILARDIAAVLRAWQPRGEIVVLASPNVSSRVGYYGRFATLGTLYWENDAGLKAAARLLSEEDEDAICRSFARHHITHVVFVSNDDFSAEFYSLLHPHATPEAWLRSLGGRMVASRPLPRCMAPLPYEPPDDLREPGTLVRLFAVRPS